MSIHAPGQPEIVWDQASIIVRFLKPDTFKVEPVSIPSIVQLSDRNSLISTTIKAEFLFGQPSKGFRATLSAKPRAFVSPSNTYREYNFTSAQDKIRLNDLKIETRTDEEGIGLLKFTPPAQWINSESFTCDLTIDVFNGAGETQHHHDILLAITHPFIIGTMVDEEARDLPMLKWVAVDDKFENHSLQDPLTWDIYRETSQRKMIDNGSGQYAWSRVNHLEKVLSGNIPSGENSGAIDLAGLEFYAPHVIQFQQGDKIISSRKFSPSYSKSTYEAQEDVRYLDITAKGSRIPGEETLLEFELPVSGYVRIDKQFGHDSISSVSYYEQGNQKIPVKLPQSQFGSVHFIVTFIPNPELETSRSLPSRMIGREHIQLDQANKRMDVSCEYSNIPGPGESAQVLIKLSSKGKPTSGAVHLFGVDTGLIPSSSSNTLKPYKGLYGPRKLNAEFHDMFEQIFPNPYLIEELNRKSAIGGGVGGIYLNPFNRDLEKLATFSLDTLYIDDTGEASASFEWPELDGKMKIFAIAINEDQIGYAEDEVTLTNPISVHLGGPVAVTSEDNFQVSALLTNSQNEQADIRLILEATGLKIKEGKPTRTLTLPSGGTQSVNFALTPIDGFLGNAEMKFLLESGDFSKSFSLTTSVRSAKPRDFISRTIIVPAGQELKGFIRSPFILKTSKTHIEINDTHLGSIKNSLRWLNTYPYGCLEQTVSGAFPNLYLQEFAGSGESIDPESGAKIIYSALENLELKFWSGQGFNMWGQNNPNAYRQRPWHVASIYASHFIAKAKNSGFKLGNIFEKELRFWLTKMSRPERLGSFEASEDVSYFLYVLSLFGEADLHYLDAILADYNTSNRAKLFIAGTFCAAGQRDKAYEILDRLAFKDIFPSKKIERDILSDVAAAGMALGIISEINPESQLTSKVIGYLSERKHQNGTWATTFNNANVAVGMGQYLQNQTSYIPPLGSIKLNDEEAVSFGKEAPFTKTFSGVEPKFIVKNEGESNLTINIYQSGIPKVIGDNLPGDIPTDNEKNLKIDDSKSHFSLIKKYFKNDSMNAPPEWKDGEEIEVEIHIPENSNYKDIVIVDPFPGFLVPVSSVAPQLVGFNLKHCDTREDRIIFFGDKLKEASQIRYKARVRYRGDFSIPPAYAEVMYAPEIRATSAGKDRVSID